MDYTALTLVKVGGSLLDWPELPRRLRSFLDHETHHGTEVKIVLIVGGGAAADFIRGMDRIHHLGDDAAHRLAIHSLDLSAQVLQALLPGSSVVADPDEFQSAWDRGEVPIFAPRRFLERLDDPHADRL